MSKKTKIIIIVIVAVIVVLWLFIFLLRWLKTPKPAVTTPAGNVNQDLLIPAGTPKLTPALNNAKATPIKDESLQAGLKSVAMTFAERFGSYSNQGNFSNLDSMRDIMTEKMISWVDNYKKSQNPPAVKDQPVYYGITTQALSVQIDSFDETSGEAQVLVLTQRQESKATTVNPRVYYQNLKIILVKTGQGWKVDSAEWQS
jgi:hypothetical protein